MHATVPTAKAVMPNAWLFGIALVIIGVSALTFTNSTNSLMQLSTEPVMRGRVMAIRLAIAMGCTPIGAPIVGWVADRFGPRWALGIGAASGFAAAIIGIHYLVKYRRLSVWIDAGHYTAIRFLPQELVRLDMFFNGKSLAEKEERKVKSEERK